MSALSRFHTWWRGLTHRGRLENEIETEMRFHIESYAEELIGRGVERKEAMRRARAELGSVAAQKDEIRASLGLRPWDDLRADARYAIRQLRQAPGFTLTVVFVLMLGIGASTAMFSVLDVTLLRELPYPHSNQLVSVRVKDARNTLPWNFYADIEKWQARTRSLTTLAYYADNGMYLLEDGEWVSAPSVSTNLFAALGVRPAMGRGFLPEEQQPGGRKVVVLSDRLWSKLYHRDPQILGQQIRLNDKQYTVVGVMPPGFAFPIDANGAQVWVPAEITSKHHKRDFSTVGFHVIGRMQDGAAPTAVQAELTAIEQPLAPLYKELLGEEPDSLRVEVSRYRETLVRDMRPALLALVAAVAFMWLIACANVANLMLARGIARQREIAVRGALGERRERLMRQLFTESLLLSLLGAGCGLGLAQASLRLFEKALRTQLRVPTHLTPNPQVLGALLVLSVLSAVIFGLLPAWLAARTPIEQSMRAGSPQASNHRKRHRLQQILVVAELSLSLTLLIGCGLMLRTLFALRRVPLGFRVDHVLVIRPAIPQYKYRNVDMNRAIYRPLQERVQQVEGVAAAAIATSLPLNNEGDTNFDLNVTKGSGQSQAKQVHIHARLKAVNSQFKDVLGFRMYKGRFFDDHDTQDSQPVAVVNRAFADLYAPVGDIIDNFSLSFGPNRNIRVVGIMDDFHQAAINQPAAPEMDLCAAQLKPTDSFYQPTLQVRVEVAVRTTRDPAKVIPDIRRAMSEVSTDLQASSFETMDQVVEDSMGSQLLATRLLEIFGGSAMLMALAGLYGLLMYLVSQRTQELGVRMALGAQREMIISLILKQAGRMLLAGTATGLIVAFFSSRLLASFLYGVKHHDLWTAVSVSAVLLACGLTAAYLPARRASRVDPVETLRAS